MRFANCCARTLNAPWHHFLHHFLLTPFSSTLAGALQQFLSYTWYDRLACIRQGEAHDEIDRDRSKQKGIDSPRDGECDAENRRKNREDTIDTPRPRDERGRCGLHLLDSRGHENPKAGTNRKH